MPDELIVREATRWLRYAREDFHAAKSLFDKPRHVCLLAQQSAEKAMKSIYAFLDLQIPRTHDLNYLKSLLPEGWAVKTSFDDLSELSYWAVESRYPGDMPEATRDDADAALKLADAILKSVEHDLRKNGLPI